MTDTTKRPNPSDITLDNTWVALKPGSYPVRTDLTPYKGTNYTASQLNNYKPVAPFGIVDSNSAVYIYPQGTIEVIGKVYCWNRLIKPGIYSRYEKIRYLESNDEVIGRSKGIETHHQPYNKNITISNPYVKRFNAGKQNLIEYAYVSFDEAITLIDGSKQYPIPIINGKLTLYPDGTFKTEGIVIDSLEGKRVQAYGYLGDGLGYKKEPLFYNSVNKDDVNPKNVYKIISENDDGSITYGPIESNTNIKPDLPPMLPVGIIPINGGEVTCSNNGIIKIKGLVINGQGYRITSEEFYYDDFCWVNTEANKKVTDNDIIYNDEYLDKSEIYNPKITMPVRKKNKTTDSYKIAEVVIHIADGKKDIYRYIPNDDIISVGTSSSNVVTYKTMEGWNTFTTEKETNNKLKHTLLDLPFSQTLIKKLRYDGITDLDNLAYIDKKYYPFITEDSIYIGTGYLNPVLGFVWDGSLKSRSIIDHRLLWFPTNLDNIDRTNAVRITNNKIVYQKAYEDKLISWKIIDKNGIETFNTFYPFYNSGSLGDANAGVIINGGHNRPILNSVLKVNYEHPISVGSFRITKRDNELYIKIIGNVLWKRNNEYYILEEGEVKLDPTWPDIKENHQLFTVNGYFTDEPIFINKKGEGVTESEIGNDWITIDGIKRQEEGLFQLVKRNVTHYLLPFDKERIDNKVYEDHYYIDNERFKISNDRSYRLDKLYTTSDTNTYLDNTLFSPNYVLSPWIFTSKFVERASSIDVVTNAFKYTGYQFSIKDWEMSGNNPITRYFRFDRAKEEFISYKDVRFGEQLSADSDFIVSYENKVSNGNVTIKRGQLMMPVQYGVSAEALKMDTTWTKLNTHYITRSNTLNGIRMVPYLECPESIILSEEKVWVKIYDDFEVPIFYRVSDTLDTITGSIIPNGRGIYQLDISLIKDSGFIDLWYDNPFADMHNLTIYRILLRKDRTMKELYIKYKDQKNVRDTSLTGRGQPYAEITLYDISTDTRTEVGSTVADSLGNWTISNIKFKAKTTYRLNQTDTIINESTSETFTTL